MNEELIQNSCSEQSYSGAYCLANIMSEGHADWLKPYCGVIPNADIRFSRI
jgi:hypothetical protein